MTGAGWPLGYSPAATAVLPSGKVSVSIVAGPGAGCPLRDATRSHGPCSGGSGATVSGTPSPMGENGADAAS